MSEKSHGIMGVLLLAAIVVALYWPVTGYEFIAMDDNMYVVENPHIQKGISFQGISWAMTTLYTTNWHPLTWLSLMADYELYGLNAPATMSATSFCTSSIPSFCSSCCGG
jgi:hypothetical protein